MSSWQDKVIEVAKGLDFNAKNEENYWLFSQGSPAGQDFNIELDTDNIDGLIETLQDRYEDYDCSEEAYIWLDHTGHGKNGAPYDMKDVYEDMEWCESKIKELADAVSNIRNEIVNFEKCEPVFGPNSKQWWVYASDRDVYVDPPKVVLDELKGYEYPDGQEKRLDEIIAEDPDWLQDIDYWIGEDVDI